MSFPVPLLPSVPQMVVKPAFQSIFSNVKRLITLIRHSEDSGGLIEAASAVLSPFMPDTVEMHVVSQIRLQGGEVPHKKDKNFSSLFLSNLKEAVIQHRQGKGTLPRQYFFNGIQPDECRVEEKLSRLSVSHDFISIDFLRKDDAIMIVLNSQSGDRTTEIRRLEALLEAATHAAKDHCGTLLVVLDESLYTCCVSIFRQYTEKPLLYPWKIAVVTVPAFGPPALEYALTEAFLSTKSGISGTLPLVCAGVATGLLRTAPVSACDSPSIVPVDMAINVALLTCHRMLHGDFGPKASPKDAKEAEPGIVKVAISPSSRNKLAWGMLRAFALAYLNRNSEAIRTAFSSYETLLCHSPSLSFRTSVSDSIQLRGMGLASIPLLERYREAHRQKEVRYRDTCLVDPVKIEALVKDLDKIWENSSTSQPIEESPASEHSILSQQTKGKYPLHDGNSSSAYRYHSMLSKLGSHYQCIPYCSYVFMDLLDWEMYVMVVMKAVLQNLPQHFLLPVPSKTVLTLDLPTPSREYLNFARNKKSLIPGFRYLGSTASLFLNAGLLPHGKNYELSPGITPKRIAAILVQPDVERVMTTLRLHEGITEEEITKRAKKILLRIGDTMNDSQSRVLGTAVFHFFSRIYDKIELNTDAFERLLCWTHLPRVQVVLIPLHRSYIDFMILSLMLFAMHLQIPHVVSGEDFLNMGPLTSFMRGTGGFFMRRSFNNDPLYAILFREYVRQLVLHGQLMEFFIEGTRSRTGKTLSPKMGILKFITDSFFGGQKEIEDVLFVPISLSYDQLLEAPVYAKELLGIPKPKENIANMIRGIVSMKQDYGSIRIHVGEAISLQSVHAERKQFVDKFLKPPAPVDLQQQIISSLPFQKPNVLKGRSLTPPYLLPFLAHRIISEMEKNVVITPTGIVAAALECMAFVGGQDATAPLPITEAKDHVASITRWIAQRKGNVMEDVSNSTSDEILRTGLHHLSGSVEHNKHISSVCLVNPIIVAKMIVHMSTNQVVHLFIEEAVVSVVLKAYGKRISGKEEQFSMTREDLIRYTDFVRCVFSQEFPCFSHGDSEWLTKAVGRLNEKNGEHFEKERPLLKDEVSISAENFAIPDSKLLRFTQQFLYPYIDSMYCVTMGFLVLFQVSPQTSINKKAFVTAIHQSLLDLFDAKKIFFAASCSKDSLHHHLSSLMQMKLVKSESTNGVIVYSPCHEVPFLQLSSLVDQLDRLRFSGTRSEELKKFMETKFLQHYKETALKSKV